MSIERAEKLKELLTDKYVVVDSDAPELKRFQNWTGKVRTVNMSCRALVEFDGPADIGWYDIDPDYLKVVDAPVKRVAPVVAKVVTAPVEPPKSDVANVESVKVEAAVAKPATVTTAGKSPLDLIRAQQAAKSGPSPLPAVTTPTAKASPLDLIRKQQAAKAAAAAPPAAVPETAPPSTPVAEPLEPTQSAPVVAADPIPANPLPTSGTEGKPLSKVDQIRMQGPKKK